MPLLHLRPASEDATAMVGEDDHALVAAAQRDPVRFEPLFRRYWEPVLRYCSFRLGSREDAEDAASQIFVDAYGALHRFSSRGGSGSFRAWLFTIAHHEIANRYRYRTRHPEHPWTEVAEALPDPAVSPESAAIAAAERVWLLGLLRELPDRSREVVELRLAGLTDREIAGVLEISGAAVRQAQSRALAGLRQKLDTRDDEHEKRTSDG